MPADRPDRPDRPDGPYPARWACTVCAKANNVGRRLTCEQCGTLAAYPGSDRERLRQIESLVQFDVNLRHWISCHLPDSDFFVQLQVKLHERRRREWFVGREHRVRTESFSSEPEIEPIMVMDSDARPPPQDRRRSGSGSGSGLNSYLANHIMASRARWHCPLCEYIMLARHTYCRKCHYRRDLTLESSKLPTRNRSTVQACLRCHGKVFDGQDQCRQCLQKTHLNGKKGKSKLKRQVSRKPPDVIELLESEEESEHESTASDGQNEIVEIETNLPGRSEASVEIVDLSDPPSSPASSQPLDPNEITFEEDEEEENQTQDHRNAISIG